MRSTQKERPEYSIVIPTFNNTSVLMNCLESLCGQSTDNESFEVVLINDGDDDLELAKKIEVIGQKIPVIFLNQDHQGPAAARNYGIRKARGEIILFLDDDSLPTANWLQATDRAWRKYTDFDGIGGMTASELKGSLICRVNTDIFNWYLKANSFGESCAFLSTHNTGYRKAVLEKIGLFDESFKRASGEDRDLSIKISMAGGRLRIDESILVYHDRDLNLRAFAGKYFGYGKASYEISKRYPEVGRLSLRSYLALFGLGFRRYKLIGEKISVLLLIVFSQMATFSGFGKAMCSALGRGRR